jgi:3-deoxy-manno-octulosonate cytidylyltransferase (CMP-KDO synthetase)
MSSAMSKINNVKDLQNTNVVKVVTDLHNNALFFSRSLIPFPRDVKEISIANEVMEKHQFFRHIGIYGYRKDFLLNFVNLEQSYLEKIEKLEQLRALENGFKIKMIEAKSSPTGIDTQEDYEEALKKY